MTGAEPFIFGTLKGFLAGKVAEKAQERLASEITKSAWSSSAAQMKPGSLTDQVKQAIFNASGQYISSYADRHGILKVLGMMEAVWIEDIYTRVQFLGSDSIWQYLSLENLEEAYRETQQRRFQTGKCEKRDGLEVANEQQYLMVLGQPGAGKSTFLRRIGLEALKRDDSGYRHNCIPVFLELKRFNAGTVDIEQAIVREFETCNFPDPARSATRLLEDSKLLVLLDGLDEVPTQQMDQTITQIQDFCDRYSQNRFIVSCRTPAYRSRLRQFTDVTIADFDDEQIQQFITNWFRSKDDQGLETAQEYWGLMQQPEYASTRELAQTPLLLTFLCLEFGKFQTFSKNRSLLYKDGLDLLLKEWSINQRVPRNPIHPGFSITLEKKLLSEIAYTGFLSDILFFSEIEIVEQIREFLVKNVDASQYLDVEEDILQPIQVQQGIPLKHPGSTFSFSHLALQEYLTAQYIVDNNLLDQLIINHICDDRWREIFILVAGLMRGESDDLLLQMETATQQLLNTDNLKNLLRWAEQATEKPERNFTPAVKRAIALYLALTLPRFSHAHARANEFILYVGCMYSAIAITFEFACTLHVDFQTSASQACKSQIENINLKPNCPEAKNPDNSTNHPSWMHLFYLNRASILALDLCAEFETINIFRTVNFTDLTVQIKTLRSQLPSAGKPIEEYYSFAKKLVQAWLCELQLNPVWIKLSATETETLNSYLYANELIVRCKEAAVRVSPQVWTGIEERMLTVRDEG